MLSAVTVRGLCGQTLALPLPRWVYWFSTLESGNFGGGNFATLESYLTSLSLFPHL